MRNNCQLLSKVDQPEPPKQFLNGYQAYTCCLMTKKAYYESKNGFDH
jgi:hypothetical protein